jgi:hypothetical protein
MGEKWNPHRALMGKLEGKEPLENLDVDLREIVSGSLNWTHLAQIRDQLQALVNIVMKLLAP